VDEDGTETDNRAKSVVGRQRENKGRRKGKGSLIKTAENRISV
jgi:hypothetical protein